MADYFRRITVGYIKLIWLIIVEGTPLGILSWYGWLFRRNTFGYIKLIWLIIFEGPPLGILCWYGWLHSKDHLWVYEVDMADYFRRKTVGYIKLIWLITFERPPLGIFNFVWLIIFEGTPLGILSWYGWLFSKENLWVYEVDMADYFRRNTFGYL